MNEREDREIAERAVLGAWMQDAPRVGLVMQSMHVKPAWWRTNKLRGAVAVACIEMQGRNLPIDSLTVADYLRRQDTPPADLAGLSAELEACYDTCPTSAHAEYYAAILRREYMADVIRRAFSDASTRLDTEDPEMVAADTAEQMRRVLADNELAGELSMTEILDTAIAQWRQAVADLKSGKKREFGVPLPWWRLTKMVGGLPNDLIVLAARPSVGKTALEGMIRVHAAQAGKHVLAHLMDMGEERVLPRDVCRAAGVSIAKLKFGFGRHDQLAKSQDAANWLKTLPMHFLTRTTRLEMLTMRARHLKAQGKLDIITADHCQLYTYAGSDRHEMRAIVTRVTATLKALAHELAVPVLLLSQLRRTKPGEQDLDPELDDLRDSGSLEQDAAIVMFLHRNVSQVEKWDKAQDQESKKDRKRPIDLLIKKNQDGRLGRIPLLMYPHYFQFELADKNFQPTPDDDPMQDEQE
jgi:replicative DNA helicase